MKPFLAVCFLAFVSVLSKAQQPDGLKLPAGFHATVVAEGLGPIRHLAVRANGDIYVSTVVGRQPGAGGIIALHLDANHKADQVEHFSSINDGTAIRFYKGDLYAASPSAVYRFRFSGSVLLPAGTPETIVSGLPTDHPGFFRANRALAFDNQGNLYVALEASGNLCTDPNLLPGASAATAPVGLNPCPDLKDRAGIWRFAASKLDQKFPTDGEHVATGVRDTTALDWSPADDHLYVILQGRDETHKFWPQAVSEQDDFQISDEMHRVDKGSDFGWPYTYYDGVRQSRLLAPEYGGDGKKTAPAGKYSAPVLTFRARRKSPVDLMFYTGRALPASYRDGAFIVLHGTQNQYGYDVVFVPFNHNGIAGQPTVFADGFAGSGTSEDTHFRAKYRPIGIATGPDGAIYIADSQKGTIWRIAYGNN